MTAQNDLEPTGHCLACGAYLLPGLYFCGPACASDWAGMGAAYATDTGAGIRVEETDSNGRTVRAWISRYF